MKKIEIYKKGMNDASDAYRERYGNLNGKFRQRSTIY